MIPKLLIRCGKCHHWFLRLGALPVCGICDRGAAPLPPAVRTPVISIPAGSTLEQIERTVILRTLEATGGCKTAAAQALGLSRRSIYNKLTAYAATDEMARVWLLADAEAEAGTP